MALLSTPRERAGLLILVLAIAIFLALAPFFSGLLGAAVLYVLSFIHIDGWRDVCPRASPRR
jgi:hypothetical protein